MKKKLLILVTKSNFGGAQRYVYDLATNLSPEEFEIVVAFGPSPDNKPGRLAKLLREKGIRTILLDELGRDMSLSEDWKAFRMLMGMFSVEKPDIVHLNSSKAGGLGALAARLSGVKRIIFTAHGLPFDENRGALQKFFITLASWLTMMLAHMTIAVSNDTFERARRLPFLWKRVMLIHNGVLTPTFLSEAEARKEIRSLDTIPDGHWIGSVGELHANKDYATAIDALSYTESAQLVILGNGEEKERLLALAKEKGVSDRVHLVGYVPDAAKYLRAFDVFVLSSQKEGLPYVLLEAGYAYLPVVATDIAGVRDIILPDFTGVLVPPRDGKALAMAIERLLGNATLARSISDELLKRVQRTFSLEGMIEKTTRLYLSQ